MVYVMNSKHVTKALFWYYRWKYCAFCLLKAQNRAKFLGSNECTTSTYAATRFYVNCIETAEKNVISVRHH